MKPETVELLLKLIFNNSIEYDPDGWYDIWAKSEILPFIKDMNLVSVDDSKRKNIGQQFANGWEMRGFYLGFARQEYKMELFSETEDDYEQFILE